MNPHAAAAPASRVAAAAAQRAYAAPAQLAQFAVDGAGVRTPASVEAVLAYSLLQHRRAFAAIGSLQHDICAAAVLMADCLHRGGRLLMFGSGGAAAVGAHLAARFAERLRSFRLTPAVLALGAQATEVGAGASGAIPSASIARQLAACGRANDCAVALASASITPELCHALKAARALGVASVVLLGEEGRSARSLADIAVTVPHRDEAIVQEAQLFIGHAWCEQIEAALAG